MAPAIGEDAKLATSTLYDENVHFGTHLEVWGSWYDTEKQCWGYACCKGTRPRQRRCPKTAPLAEGEAEEEEDLEVKVSRRVAELLEKNPGFCGDVPTPDQERNWSDAELRNYLHSNGLIRPARTKGEQRPAPTAADWKVLELEPGADPSQLKKAYRRLALQFHPDKHRGDKDKAAATEKFRKVVAAYEAIAGHVAEIPAVAATTDGGQKRRWRIVIVE
ncbi:Chaperone protein DnaJ [Symbiodinium microadriaticum]|uniref:Chaperone protein DnaJ n=1 Tax=Symbiodinium microadriaticum TaxID=2951 RepID=A0A1Q9E2X5_SYMMI|nr:Chaperone protein DnaJ [Symbiodinium microadriaticum]CAE7825821.1 dnaJ [Symbiodinium microadriaticum]CAE7945803.1 dnaJ [Symbiodinium sp. KB8]